VTLMKCDILLVLQLQYLHDGMSTSPRHLQHATGMSCVLCLADMFNGYGSSSVILAIAIANRMYTSHLRLTQFVVPIYIFGYLLLL
jgi:hypothetical protein